MASFKVPTSFPQKIIAHRGGPTSERPENSYAALEYAAQKKLWSEVDVRQTQDDFLVLMHDDSIDRTTTGSGRVADMTLRQLQSVSLKAPATMPVPTLPEALAIPNAHLMLELKRDNGAKDDGLRFTQSIVNTIYKQDCMHRIKIGSFDITLLQHVRSIDSTLPTIGIAETQEELKTMLAFQPDVLAVDHKIADLALSCKADGMSLWVWTVNDITRGKQLLDQVDAVITDRPYLF